MLAISADKSYAAPGDTVTMDVLAVDGRSNKSRPMRVFWVPIACPNPPSDAYFACYPAFGAALPTGVDLTNVLHEGTQFSFQVASNIISSHPPPASGAPYGVDIVFAIACAGHVEYVARDNDTIPPQPPLGCFDDGGTELGPDDSVFAYAQVFSFAGRTNANPVLTKLTADGMRVDAAAGIQLVHCGDTGPKACKAVSLDADVPASSQEPDPGDIDANGKSAEEEIWIDYYATGGSLSAATSLLYDAHAGRLPKTAVSLAPPLMAGEWTLYAVLHDNRGGVSWTMVPVHVQ